MRRKLWPLLEELQEGFRRPSEFPMEKMQLIAERLEQAAAYGSKQEIEILNEQLSVLFRTALISASPEVYKAVVGEISESQESDAYVLGQMSFAQHLAAYIFSQRAGDEFLEVLLDKGNCEYIKALYRQDLSGKGLAQLVRERGETVSRKLKRLREVGATDFRREGTTLINFLTPAARAAVDEAQRDLSIGAGNGLPRAIAAARQSLPDYLQQPLTFAYDQKVG